MSRDTIRFRGVPPEGRAFALKIIDIFERECPDREGWNRGVIWGTDTGRYLVYRTKQTIVVVFSPDMVPA
jgi:hypothetical protein